MGADQLTHFECIPFVFDVAAQSSAILVVGVENPDVTMVEFDPSQFSSQASGPWFSATPLLLKDDGVAPDELAGDQLFSATLTLANPAIPHLDRAILRLTDFTLHLASGNQIGVTEDVAYSIGAVQATGPTDVTRIGPSTFIGSDGSSAALNLVDESLFLSSAYPTYTLSTSKAASAVYDHVDDSVDWLTFFRVYNQRGNPAGTMERVRNPVSGIGQSVFDNSALFGSSGVLRGVIQHYFKHVTPMTHETFHTWGVYGFDAFGLGPFFSPGHWGALTSTSTDTLFGFPGTYSTLSMLPNGNYCALDGDGPAHELELYLAGLLPAHAVPDYEYLEDAQFIGFVFTVPLCSELSGTGVSTLTMSQIEAQFGARDPPYPDQSTFTAAVAVVSDRELEPVEWTFINDLFDDYPAEFNADYQGLATISFPLEVPDWSYQGFGYPGVHGVPLLTGRGGLGPGETGSLNLVGAAGSAIAGLFISLASTPVPFKGGLLAAFPPVIAGQIWVTSPSGEIVLPLTVPPGIPSNTDFWVQWAIQDAAAVHGVSLSNAILGVTP